MKSTILTGQTFVGDASFEGQRLQHFAAVGCEFRGCSFGNFTCDDFTFAAGTEATRYLDCDFARARLKVGSVGPARFVNCRFENADITGMLSLMGEFVDCTFSGKLRKAVFYGYVSEDWRGEIGGRSVNEFTGNDFSRAELIDVAFRGGIDLALQKFPAGETYLILPQVAERIAAVAGEIGRLPEQQQVQAFIRWLEFESGTGQRDLLLKRPAGGFPPAQQGVLALLTSASTA